MTIDAGTTIGADREPDVSDGPSGAGATQVGLPVRVLIAAIGGYRTVVSPLRPPTCRYLPTCSEYALDALRTWGLARGGWLALRRLLRCHPLHAGGLDPVPARPSPLAESAV